MPNLAKDFHRLYKRIGRLSDGQASLTDIQWDDAALSKFTVLIQPNSGYYTGGSFKFLIHNLQDYNCGGLLSVLCLSKIYHPNIDPTCEDGEGGNVCLNLLDYSSPTLEGIVLGILFLLNNPNFDDPLSPVFDRGEDHDTFAETIQNWINGEEIEGVKYGSMLSLDGVDDLDNVIETEGTDKSENEIAKETVAVAGAAAEHDTAGESAHDIEVKNSAEAKEDGDDTYSNEDTGTNEKSNTAADAVDNELNAQIEAFMAAESGNGNEDEDVCEDIELSLLMVDGEVLMIPEGLIVENIDATTNEMNEGENTGNYTADGNNSVIRQNDTNNDITALAEGGVTIEENEQNGTEQRNSQIKKISDNIDDATADVIPKSEQSDKVVGNVRAIIEYYNQLGS